MDVCDPDAKTKNIRKLIKLHTGKTIKISRDRICDIMKDVDRGNLPLPPLVLTRDKRYLLDPKSPLTRKDFENLFKSNVTSKVVKRLARKVGLIETDKTISDLKRAIGRKLASMNVREPVLLPGSRVYSKIKNEDFVNEMTPIQNNENREENRNREENQNRNRNREENQNRNRNRNREENQNQNRNRGVNINSSGRSLRNTLARKRHMDRIKQLTGSSVSNIPSGNNRRNIDTKMQIEKAKLNADRRIQEQKRNFNRRFSEKQVVEERRKRREARIIETKVQNGRRAQINADNRARKAEAARNREYENKKRAQLKANTNSQRVKRLEKNYANLRNKTKSTLNRYNLNRKRAFTQLSESQSKMRTLGDKLRKEVDRANLERDTSKKLQSDLDVAKSKIEKSEQRIKEIEKERDMLNTTITDLQLRLDTKTKDGNEDEVEKLTKELNDAKAKIEKLTNEVTTLTNNTKQVVADATKDLNAKLAQAVLASNANKKKAALSEAKYKAARSEMNSKNRELALRERDSKSRKRVKLNALLTNIGVSNKTSLMNEYNAGIKNGKNPNDMINSIVKRARLSNKEAARVAASISATAVAKASMQNELNKIKDEKEKALEKAANERRNAVAAAEKATRERALAETAAEKVAAEKKLKNAQNKISAAAANKEQALKNAAAERNVALKKAQENKNVEVASARMVATATAKASMQSELNKIKNEKEKALEKAANERRSAVAAAEKATREKALAETATEKAAAEQKLKNAQTKISAAAANKQKALENAKTERNATLKKAMNNKQKAINGLRADRNLKLKNKNAATRNAQAKLNTIRKEKENALALANAEKKKAVALAEEASKAKAAANTLAEKTAAEKKAAEAKRIQEEAAAKMKAASNKAKAAREKIDATLRAKAQKARNAVQKQKNDKAAANKAAANKAAANKAAANKAAANKAAANKAAANAEVLKRQRQNVQKRMANAKLVSNRKLAESKIAKIAKVRKILATYKTINPFRKSTVEKQGEDLIQKFQRGELVQIEAAIVKLVRDMKKKNNDTATEKMITAQTTKASEQFNARKKKEVEDKEKARLARIEIQKREGKKVAADRALAQFKLNAKRSKNAMANKKAIDAMKNASNKKVVSNLVSGALTKAIKSGPVTTIYQSSTNANRDKVKNKVEEKVETKGYKAVWGTMIDLDGKDKTSLNKIETKLNKKYVLKQGIQQLPGAAFRKGRVPGSGVAARTSLLTQVMRPYIGGDDKYVEHKKQYNNAFKVYKNPAFGNTKSSKVNGMVTANNVVISMKRAPVPPPGVKPPNGRFRAIARAQIPPAKPTAMARAVQISMNKRKAVGNPAIARKAYTNQAKFKQNADVRRAAERAAVAAKAYVARNAKFRATGVSQIASDKADARRAQLAARKAAKKKLK